MSDITLVSKSYVDSQFGENDGEEKIVLATKEYVDSKGVCIEYRDTNTEQPKTYKTYWGLSDLTDCESLGVIPGHSENVVSVKGDFPKLENGNYMFSSKADSKMQSAVNLASFEGNMPNLINAIEMFEQCNNLVSFKGDLSKLQHADGMFTGAKFTTFESPLSSLVNAPNMFNSALFDYDSLKFIADSLPSYTDEEDHLITISFREGSVTADQLKEVKGILKDKGWSAIVSPN